MKKSGMNNMKINVNVKRHELGPTC